jgi:hypothetical protein
LGAEALDGGAVAHERHEGSRERVGPGIGEAIARALSRADGAAGEPADLRWQRR